MLMLMKRSEQEQNSCSEVIIKFNAARSISNYAQVLRGNKLLEHAENANPRRKAIYVHPLSHMRTRPKAKKSIEGLIALTNKL
jgi:hypothetical protein